MCEVRVKKKVSVYTRGVLLTLVRGKDSTPLWKEGVYSQSQVVYLKKGEVVLGLGLEWGSKRYLKVLINGGRVLSVADADVEIV